MQNKIVNHLSLAVDLLPKAKHVIELTFPNLFLINTDHGTRGSHILPLDLALDVGRRSKRIRRKILVSTIHPFKAVIGETIIN